MDAEYLGRKLNHGVGTHFMWENRDIRYNMLRAVGYFKVLFVVFVILWYIVDVVYVTLSIYNLPMGFDIENTYVLRFGTAANCLLQQKQCLYTATLIQQYIIYIA